MCISYMETDVTCPICTFSFDSSERASKAKDFIFKMKCPACKSWVGVRLPIFGGNTQCFEWNPPKTKKDNQLRTVSPDYINGIPVYYDNERKNPDNDNSDNPKAFA